MAQEMTEKNAAFLTARDGAKTATELVNAFALAGIPLDNDEIDGIKSIPVIKDKNTLLGTPFIMVEWRFNDGDHGTFVSIEIMTENGDRFILNDGSTGICAQVAALTEHRTANDHPAPTSGRMVKRGLRRSDYPFTDEKGKTTTATTYYLDY